MATTDKNTLIGWFVRGAKPTAAQFSAWLNSFWHKDENIPLSKIDGIYEALDAKANTSAITTLQDGKADVGLLQYLFGVGSGFTLESDEDIPLLPTFSEGKSLKGVCGVYFSGDGSEIFDAARHGVFRVENMDDENILHRHIFEAYDQEKNRISTWSRIVDYSAEGGEIVKDWEKDATPIVSTISQPISSFYWVPDADVVTVEFITDIWTDNYPIMFEIDENMRPKKNKRLVYSIKPISGYNAIFYVPSEPVEFDGVTYNFRAPFSQKTIAENTAAKLTVDAVFISPNECYLILALDCKPIFPIVLTAEAVEADGLVELLDINGRNISEIIPLPVNYRFTFSCMFEGAYTGNMLAECRYSSDYDDNECAMISPISELDLCPISGNAGAHYLFFSYYDPARFYINVGQGYQCQLRAKIEIESITIMP